MLLLNPAQVLQVARQPIKVVAKHLGQHAPQSRSFQ